MSEFSDLFSALIKSKNIKITAMSEYCALDRSTLYKIMKGKRNPTSEKVVKKFSEFMRLSPIESGELMESYYITVTGHDTYYRRKSVMELFSDFSTSFYDLPNINVNYLSFQMDHSVLTLNSRTELEHVVYSIIMLETLEETGYIKLMLQPDDPFIMKILTLAGKEKENLKIDHIICLNNTEIVTNTKRDYNLQCLRNILPLYICNCNYNSYYYYDNILSHSKMFNVSPYMIITSNYLIELSSEMDYGVIYHNEELLQSKNRTYQDLLKYTTRLGQKMESLQAQIDYFAELHIGESKGVSFQIEPCLIPMLSENIISKYLNEHLPKRNYFLQRIFSYIEAISETAQNSKTTFIFTEDGVLSFLETGRLSEIPNDMYHSFSMQDRLLLIRQLIHKCKSQNYRMLNRSMKLPQAKLCTYVNQQQGYLLFPSLKNELVYLDLRESGLLNAFFDFWENLDENLFYTLDETIMFLNTQLKRFRLPN